MLGANPGGSLDALELFPQSSIIIFSWLPLVVFLFCILSLLIGTG